MKFSLSLNIYVHGTCPMYKASYMSSIPRVISIAHGEVKLNLTTNINDDVDGIVCLVDPSVPNDLDPDFYLDVFERNRFTLLVVEANVCTLPVYELFTNGQFGLMCRINSSAGGRVEPIHLIVRGALVRVFKLISHC